MLNNILEKFNINLDSNNIQLALNVTKIPKTSIVAKPPKNKNRNTNNYINSALATLGDSIIKMVLCEKLFLQDKNRAQITDERAELENDEILYNKAVALGLNKFIYATKKQDNDQLPSDYASVYEAFIGAIYLEKGFEITKRFILEQFE